MKKEICVLTATRAEYGLLYPLLKEIEADQELALRLVVSGTHLSNAYGLTRQEIIRDGFTDFEEIEILTGEETTGSGALAVSKTMARAVSGLAAILDKRCPDMAVILGDRYEMLAFVLALVNANVPVAHINGGEVTEGALDDRYRHALTKLSLLHFTNCEAHRRRVIQMGEDPARVFSVGDLCVDNIKRTKLLSIGTLEEDLGVSLRDRKVVLVTFHPVTAEKDSLPELRAMLMAIAKREENQYIITYANADAGGDAINRELHCFAEARENVLLVPSLGRVRYLSLLSNAYAVIGNSSSGIYEAPYFHIPTVNMGNRQKGRLHGGTVIDCEGSEEAIEKAMDEAFSPAFREKCRNEKNLFGDGHAAERIVYEMKKFLHNGGGIEKAFFDIT